MKEKLKEVLDRTTDYSGSKKRKVGKGILGAVVLLLLGTLGMEITNNDFDLGALIAGEGLDGSKVLRDEDGNIDFTGVSPLIASCEAEQYNCSDFLYQAQAQDVMVRCGGEGKDIHNLDGDNDGRACQALPQS